MKINLLDSPSEDVRIEIIPLVDVIFCILTFFILAAVGLTRQQAIDLDLPPANTGNPLPPQGLGAEAAQRERLYVSVDSIGQIYLDQQPVSEELLADVLLQHRQVSPEGLIVLYASRDARYEDVIRVLDQLRAVGGNRVALATLPGVTSQTPVPGAENLPPGSSPLPGNPLPQTGNPDDGLLDLSPFPGSPDASPAQPGSNPDLTNPGSPFQPLPSSPTAPGSANPTDTE